MSHTHTHTHTHSVMEYLLTHAQRVQSCNVIELGAGTGITGMLCKRLGCATATLTDHDQRSIDHMTLDVVRNDIDCSVVKLDWYEYNEEETFRLVGRGVSECTSEAVVPVRIVAGDVLYKDVLIEPFFTVTRSLLSLEGSEMLLCHVPRAGVEQQRVVDACGEYGLCVSKVAHDEWKKGIVIEYSTPDDYERAELYIIKKSE